MDSAALLGMVVLVAVIILGLLMSRGLLAAALPFRQRLYEQGSELLRGSGLTRTERAYVTYCMDHAFSFRAGLMPVRAAWLALRARKRGELLPVTTACEEVQQVGLRFMASVLCANPFAAMVFVVMLVTLMVWEHESPKPAFQQTATKLPASYKLMRV